MRTAPAEARRACLFVTVHTTPYRGEYYEGRVLLMKVLLLNGSAKRNGCTNEALSEIASVLESEGISAEIFHIGTDAICDCTGCGACAHLGRVHIRGRRGK